MTDLTIIREGLQDHITGEDHHQVRLIADRLTLTKRRWRGAAEDGRKFGFDLEGPLIHGTSFLLEENRLYVIEQKAEVVLEIPLTSLEQAAQVAWGLGNLHFGIQVLPRIIRVKEDPAALAFLERQATTHRRTTCVFQPLSARTHHHHAPSHAHA
jgi:urease accessory protein